MVVKMRGSGHSRDFRLYDIVYSGVQLREPLRQYDGILTGMPTRQPRIPPPPHPGLTEQEVLVLETVMRAGRLSAVGVSKQTALVSKTVEPILGRLVQLRYLSRNGTRYSAEPRTMGSPTELG